MPPILTLAGRFHPVLVHLPIGILLLAILLQFLRYKPAADLALGLGFLSAALSCCTGYLLSLSGEYDQSLLTTHFWLAISLTVVSGYLYVLVKNKPINRFSAGISALVLLLLLLTGHWGGSLTHGPDYLTAGLQKEPEGPTLRPVPAVQSAVAFTALVQPVLHDNCYGCHRAGHVKGGLRLDGPDWIQKGGKDGTIIQSGLLIRRILLPKEDDHHMAPKDKPQLTPAEMQLLQWWVRTGASFEKQVSSLPQDSIDRIMLLAFQKGTAGPVGGTLAAVTNVADSDMPIAPVSPASAEVLQGLRAAGALVLPIAEGSNYLEVSFPSDTIGKDALHFLPKLKDQLVSLRCSDRAIGDELLPAIAGCTHLVRLWLDHTQVTGKNLGSLLNLTELRYLNVTGTNISTSDLLTLKGLPKLRSLYVYQTKVNRSDWAALKSAFSHTVLDSGGYSMPFLETDTAIVRAKAVSNK